MYRTIGCEDSAAAYGTRREVLHQSQIFQQRLIKLLENFIAEFGKVVVVEGAVAHGEVRYLELFGWFYAAGCRFNVDPSVVPRSRPASSHDGRCRESRTGGLAECSAPPPQPATILVGTPTALNITDAADPEVMAVTLYFRRVAIRRDIRARF